MKYLLALAALTLAYAQKGASVGKAAPVAAAGKAAPVAAAGKAAPGAAAGKAAVAAPPAAPVDLSKVDAELERKSILAMQVQSTLENEQDANGGNLKGTVVDLVLQSLAMNFTATCSAASKDYLTCVNGYVSLDCKFQQSAASFGGVNCIPYLSQCADAMLEYCQSKVPKAEKCKAVDACACAQESGCGWSRGHMMCLVNRDQVSCGDCPTMSRCGKIDCPSATRPCDCAAMGGACGWSTSSWRCESGKDTDCNECAEQTECGGPGLAMKHQDHCPATVPAQLSACKEVVTCPYDKKCCPRCAGAKQVCAETQAECDGMTWELRSSALVCPDCEDYYYDDISADAPSEPIDITASQITQTAAVIAWKAPVQNFKAGVDGYSVAYAEDKANDAEEKLEILPLVTVPRVSLTGLLANKVYKLSILPVTNGTENVGVAGTLDFKTLPAAAVAGKAKAKAGKAGKAATGKAKSGRR